MTETIYAVDLFCGGGGTSTGLAQACRDLGRSVELVAINHWAEAIETHTLNHPWAKHLCQNVEAVDPRTAVPGRHLHALVASPECFPAATLILCEKGWVQIEEIGVGDLVLTHMGRWRRVTAVGTRKSDTVIVKGKGHPGLEVTQNHPILTRSRRLFGHRPKWLWSPEEWIKASETEGKFWACPRVFPEIRLPELPLESQPESFWWSVGYWLGNGYADTRKTKGGAISIATSKEKAPEWLLRLAKGFPGRWTQRDTRTATLLELRSWPLVNWLVDNFGKLALGKRLPIWALGMPREWRQALLEGYVAADGHNQHSFSTVRSGGTRKVGVTTISKQLAFGVRLLAESLGYHASISLGKARDNPIEGRKVSTHDLYTIIWPVSPQRSIAGETKLHSWTRIRAVKSGSFGVTVYNLSIEEDESYVAEGVVVHNCTFHSRAAGGRPKNDQRRSSAWQILRWLELLEVDALLVENVPEFRNWGPLDEKGFPVKSRNGEIYQSFISAIRAFGYNVDAKVLNAADYGAPTSRSRIFIQARKGNRAVNWPTPTHSKKGTGRHRWRAAKEIIDWSLQGGSIFSRKRPLSPRTYIRIIEGLKRFGGVELKPFIVLMEHRGSVKSAEDPLPTITTAKGGAMALVEPVGQPFILSQGSNGAPKGVDDDPVPAIMTGGKHALVETGFILSQGSGGAPRSVNDPMPTIPGGGAHALIIPMFGEREGQKLRVKSVEDTLDSVTSHGAGALAEPFLLPVEGYFQDGGRSHNPPRSVDEPLGTITQRGGGSIVEPFILQMEHGVENDGSIRIKSKVKSIEDPLQTISTSNRSGLVEPFLTQYNGTSGPQSIENPLPTISTHDRFGLVQPVINGRILDIKFRMLQPSELAAAMGFPKDYRWNGTKSNTVKMIGNAVSVDIARALCTSLLTKPKGRLFDTCRQEPEI